MRFPPQTWSRSSRISISVVVYESPAEELAQLLASLTPGHARRHVTVVDNSPTEALRATVDAAGAEYLRPSTNLGYGAGHNLAMRRSIEHSTYHLVCNPDIHCSLDTLEELGTFMDRNPDVGLVMPKVLYPDGRTQQLCKLLPTPADLLVRRFLPRRASLLEAARRRYELDDLDMRQTRLIPSLSGCFMFLRTAVLRQTGLFDPRFFLYMEDVDLCRRIGEVSKTVFYPHVSVQHDYSKGSYKSARLLLYHLTSAMRYFNKWGWLRDPERDALNRRTAAWPEMDALELASAAGRARSEVH